MAAEAEAESILKVQQAMADSMRMLNENAPQRPGHQAEGPGGAAEGG